MSARALADGERADVLRAAVGYALAEDTIGLDRWRNKYAAKMADGPDRRAFDVVTTPFNINAPEFGEVARKVSTADTLDGFSARHPDEVSGNERRPAPAGAPTTHALKRARARRGRHDGTAVLAAATIRRHD